jgi:hypothetical protein
LNEIVGFTKTEKGLIVMEDFKPAIEIVKNSMAIGENIFTEFKNTRSARHNRFERVLLKMLSEKTGYTSNQIHDIVKIKRWGFECITFDGVTYEIPARSRDKSSKEFKLLVDDLKDLATFHEIELPKWMD